MEAKDFSALRISLASPETIQSWSYGEVLKPETINYRRLRPEKDGLFCEAIFGPTKDWQCYCGKYKNVRYKGVICDKCGVEVTRAAVRRERMGHIKLAAPVAHVWYTRRVPSYMGLLLDVSRRNLDRVLYFAQYVITYIDEEARGRALKRIDEELSRQETEANANIGGQIEAIKTNRDERLGEIQGQIDAINERFNDEQNSLIEDVMKEAQLLQRRVENMRGQTLSDPILFESASELVVDSGEVITNEVLSRIQRVVSARLSEIQVEIEERRQQEMAQLDVVADERSAEAASQIEALQGQTNTKMTRARGLAIEARQELANFQVLTFLTDGRYRELKAKYGNVFKADMGAEAFHEILKNMNLEKLAVELWDDVRSSKSKQRKKKATKRLRVVESLRKSRNRPEWMIMTILPVIPPDLRPMVQLDGGRFATSDLNDLYRRVINRNNRLKRLMELGAPDVIVRNEKRMLQEAVDSLVDNSQRGKALSRRGRRELKSLSDMLKGKKGRFRRNLLGKRVDYSGRSVIVIGPKLKLHQCGLPKTMALELYRPFVISKLVKYGYISNVKGARRLIEKERPEVWEVLEEVIKERPVLLNRAPTLHRLGIQAFEPQLVEGKAIQIHPLVCSAFNADFDGDQMAVHVPLSTKAVEEARRLMLSTKNLLKPADGQPVVGPSKDMVLGAYYLTMDPTADLIALKGKTKPFRHLADVRGKGYKVGAAYNTSGHRWVERYELDLGNEIIIFRPSAPPPPEPGKKAGKPISGEVNLLNALLEGKIDVAVFNAYDFQKMQAKDPTYAKLDIANLHERQMVADMDEAEYLYGLGVVGLHTPILLGNYYDKGLAQPKPEITTIGRAIFNRILPDELRFVQDTMGKKQLQTLVARCYQKFGSDVTTDVVDAIKDIGFHYATISGTTIAVSDITIPVERDEIISSANADIEYADRDYKRGLMTDEERYQKAVNTWNVARDKLGDIIKDTIDPFGPVAIMAISGSTKGGFGPITQLAGMRGLMADPSGRIIELPIRSHFRMGLTALEYFISTHGARKGLADTALRTADAGYLTRRLVDVAQDVIVNRLDCGTDQCLTIHKSENVAGQSLQERIMGRCAAKSHYHPETGELIIERNGMIDEDKADELAASGLEEIDVRSPLTCALIHGICAHCYGRDMGRGELVEIGSAVGIVAAQSIGEPGTQLTLRTFHTGGTAQASGDITSGLPRVEELFEARKKPKGEAVMTDIDGVLRIVKEDGVRKAIVINSEMFNEEHHIPIDWELVVEDEQEIKEGQVLAHQIDNEGNVVGSLVAKMTGITHIEGHTLYIRYERREEVSYEIPSSARLTAKAFDGAQLKAGDPITEGSKNPHRILRIQGSAACELYLLSEVQDVYRNQGVNIADKHFEIMIRKMLSRVQLTKSGGSDLLPGELIDRLILLETNDKLINEGKEPAAGVPVLLGITKCALSTDSFLSASSFQHTIKVLAGAAIEGKEDRLYGLKENVIIGKLIPAGTGFHTYQDRERIAPNATLESQGALDKDAEIDLDLISDSPGLDDGEMGS
ncbi:MAG TPA: DNA-directed RNA polymerase subunit beta' [Aggregatilineales bacterium]|nr:DNA-directed RNA polymerase subunit beta' [Anaerolineales bacterium]HRE48169.1 DNA-directed RNA polymerase subunit beta' [Aggregatilineales bacterium]